MNMARLVVAASLTGETLTASCPLCGVLNSVALDTEGMYTRTKHSCEHLKHAVGDRNELVFVGKAQLPKTTPGPWFRRVWPMENAVDGCVAVVTDSRGHNLMESCTYGKNERAGNNMRLAAAAPELYEALAEIVLEATKSRQLSNATVQKALNVLRKAVAQ
jgi:phage FluMu protein Com